MTTSEQDQTLVDRLYASWQRAEQRSRDVAPGSPDAQERLAGAEQVWHAYEQALAKALGRGSLKTT